MKTMSPKQGKNWNSFFSRNLSWFESLDGASLILKIWKPQVNSIFDNFLIELGVQNLSGEDILFNNLLSEPETLIWQRQWSRNTSYWAGLVTDLQERSNFFHKNAIFQLSSDLWTIMLKFCVLSRPVCNLPFHESDMEYHSFKIQNFVFLNRQWLQSTWNQLQT